MLSVGDWTRTAGPGNSARVLYSLTNSRDPIVSVIIRLNGIEQGRLEGVDLRRAAGSYFTLPAFRGSYQLSVSALTVAGCEDGASRPMTITVQ